MGSRWKCDNIQTIHMLYNLITNAMKKIIFLQLVAILILTFSDSQAQKKIKKIDLKDEGSLVNIKISPSKNEIITAENKFKIELFPVDPSSLDSMFTGFTLLTGKYSYRYLTQSRNEYFLKHDIIKNL